MTSPTQHEPTTLAPYAVSSDDSGGRIYPEPDHPYRSPFARDRDRIVHSSAFRRLAYKTQVFTGNTGDYHRTRLTHTLEVASIARTLARALRLNEDYVETLALAHDIGHPPFGHAGEDTLHECAVEFGGFNHNLQALRIMQQLEQRYPDFPGLNLTRRTLDGQLQRGHKGDADARVALEVQIVDAADSIAYNSHDADDALEVGLLELAQLQDIPLWQEATDRVQQRYGKISAIQLRNATVRQLIDIQVNDLIQVTQENIRRRGIASLDDILSQPPIAFPSDELAREKQTLERFLYDSVYRHPQIVASRSTAQKMLADLYLLLSQNPALLPETFQRTSDQEGLGRGCIDYIACMTDRFAWETFGRMTAPD